MFLKPCNFAHTAISAYSITKMKGSLGQFLRSVMMSGDGQIARTVISAYSITKMKGSVIIMITEIVIPGDSIAKMKG